MSIPVEAIKQLNCPDLATLNFSFNKITKLPDDWSWQIFTGLQDLTLNNNQISNFPNNQISKLSSLILLKLSNNQFTNLPLEIGMLNQLTILDLRFNKLKTLPETIGQLTNLGNLNLGHNEITSVPSTVGNLISLYTLDLRSNNSLQALPKEISECSELKDLYLTDTTYDNNHALQKSLKQLLPNTTIKFKNENKTFNWFKKTFNWFKKSNS